MSTTYQTIINMTQDQFFDPSKAACRNGSMPPNDAYATESESVTSALAAYTATGHAAEDILSIETRTYEST